MKYNIDERLKKLRSSLDVVNNEPGYYDIWIKEIDVRNSINNMEDKWKKVGSDIHSVDLL